MAGTLGHRKQIGFLGNVVYPNRIVTGGWVVRFPVQEMPADMDYEVWHGSALGPGGYFQVWLDDSLYGIGENGSINEYSPSGPPMYVRKGQEISLHWSIATGAAPSVWLYLREPEVGRI